MSDVPEETYERGETATNLARSQGLDPDKVRRRRVPGVCDTCAYAQIMVRGTAEHAEAVVFCKGIREFVRPDLSDCSHFEKQGTMSLHEMGELALWLDTRRTGGQYL